MSLNAFCQAQHFEIYVIETYPILKPSTELPWPVWLSRLTAIQ